MMHPVIAAHRDEIAALCQRFRVRRLEVFGSAARGADFDPGRSDVDLICEFEPDARCDLIDFFDLKAAFEALLGREVDLLERGALRNPYLIREIEAQRELVYGA